MPRQSCGKNAGHSVRRGRRRGSDSGIGPAVFRPADLPWRRLVRSGTIPHEGSGGDRWEPTPHTRPRNPVQAVMIHSRLTWLILGLAAGLVVGLNLAGIWPQMPLHAVATHGQDNFAICTGPMDEDVEGVFVLDSVTGDLKAAVLNVQTRRFNTLFEYNVVRDFPAGHSKNPSYRIVSGVANIRQIVTAGQLARVVIYVAEAASGQIVAYGIPWLPGRAAAVVPYKGTLIPLDRWQYRTTPVRDN